MSTISNQWTGNGLAEGIALTTGNIDDAGNFTGSGVTWAGGPTGSPTMQTNGDGFLVTTGTATDIARLDGPLTSSSPALRAQFVFTPLAAATGIIELQVGRNATTTVQHIRYDATARTLIIRDNTNTTDLGVSPAITVGDVMVVDVVLALHAAPDAFNGRFFYRATNMTDPAWNTTGYFFYDSGETRNLQTTNLAQVRFGKINNITTIPSPGFTWQFCGIEAITVDPADTSEQDASAYFADNPVTPYGLESSGVSAITVGLRLG